MKGDVSSNIRIDCDCLSYAIQGLFLLALPGSSMYYTGQCVIQSTLVHIPSYMHEGLD